jgi:uncharacterized protein YkwD
MASSTRLVFPVVCLWSLAVFTGAGGCGAVEGLPLLGRSVAAYAKADPNACSIPDDQSELVWEVIRLVNEERTSRGLNPVEANPQLTASASDYACTMIGEAYFGHYDPVTGDGPGDRAAAAGYVYRAVGENLGAGQKTPAEVVTDWMNSTTGHRENILNPMWVHIGVAVRKGGSYGTYWVQEFGVPWQAGVPGDRALPRLASPD